MATINLPDFGTGAFPASGTTLRLQSWSCSPSLCVPDQEVASLSRPHPAIQIQPVQSWGEMTEEEQDPRSVKIEKWQCWKQDRCAYIYFSHRMWDPAPFRPEESNRRVCEEACATTYYYSTKLLTMISLIQDMSPCFPASQHASQHGPWFDMIIHLRSLFRPLTLSYQT